MAYMRRATLAAEIARSGMTRKQLAQRVGVTPATVTAWVAGRRVPRIDAALKVAEVLGTPAEALFSSQTE